MTSPRNKSALVEEAAGNLVVKLGFVVDQILARSSLMLCVIVSSPLPPSRMLTLESFTPPIKTSLPAPPRIVSAQAPP